MKFRKIQRPLLVALSTVIAIFGLTIPSQADSEASSSVVVSNYRPVVGEPIAIYASIYACNVSPTNFGVSLYHPNDNEPFATLTKSTTNFKSRKVNGEIQMKWIYSGPTGDGVDSRVVFVTFFGTGGCVNNPDDFISEASWSPVVPEAPYGVGQFSSQPDTNGLRLKWRDFNVDPDPTRYFELQYSRSTTNVWSRSITTTATTYNLRGLTRGTIYDLRIRSVNSVGASDWTYHTGQNHSRTPGLFSVWTSSTDGTPNTMYDLFVPIRANIEIDTCDYQPSTQNEWNGSLAYSLFPIKGGYPDGYNAISGTAEAGQDATINYDGATHKYSVSWSLPFLSAGEYEMYVYFFGSGCSWNFTPTYIDGSKYGDLVHFTVGPEQVTVPDWGSNSMNGEGVLLTGQSATSASFAWQSPANIEDGPFTYEISLISEALPAPKILGRTTKNTFTATGLAPFTEYAINVTAQNAATVTADARPNSMTRFTTANLSAKRSAKATAVQIAASASVNIPAGATTTISRPSGTFVFSNCTIAKNVVTYKSTVGACTVQLTIKPKKVGRVQPASIIKILDVMVRR